MAHPMVASSEGEPLIIRRKREKVKDDDVSIEGRKWVWSNWVLAMIPDKDDNNSRDAAADSHTSESSPSSSPRVRKGPPLGDMIGIGRNADDFISRATEEHERYGRKKTKALLKRDFGDQKPCGIYEWKATHQVTKTEFVVYIGSTCRSKGGNFIDRIYQYCTNGSHKSDYIERALYNGYELSVRYKGSDSCDDWCSSDRERAEYDENEILKLFDYAWNKRLVKEKERDLPENSYMQRP